MSMAPEDEEETDDEEEKDGDDEGSNLPSTNVEETNEEVVMSTDTLLDLLYLAARRNSQNGRDSHPESMNWNDCDGSYSIVNCSDFSDSDYDCNDGDGYTDGDYDDEDSDVEIILEEIRRISEALLGSTMSELVDAERRLSLKSFDELAARDESLSTILDEWDYEDSDVAENDDCQGVVERIQLFMRPPQRDGVVDNFLRDMTERSLAILNSRSAHRGNRQQTNAVSASNMYVVFFDPKKIGVFPKFTCKDEAKIPKITHTPPMKKAQRRVRFDKDSVRRWSEDDEKEEITRLVRGVRRALPAPAPTPTPTSPRGTPFAVSLPVGVAATPADVRVALHNNRVLVAEVMGRNGSGDDGGVGAQGPRECVLVRRWAVPESVDADTFRCFLGDGLLLVTALPLPEGFAWPFATPPVLLGCPLRVAFPCDFSH